jgi:hypothetical protein
MAAIIDDITSTQPGSLVVVAGDLNAKVGTAIPLSTKAAGAILQHNAACGTHKRQHIRFERKQQHPDSDFSGKLLQDMCQATHLINLTGITNADSPAAASFTSTNAVKAQKPSRIDHVLLSPSALQHLTQHQVLSHLLGSDHLPLQIVLSLSPKPAPSSSDSQQEQVPLQQIIPSKDRATIQRYITAMADPATFDELRQLADTGEASAAELNATFTRIVISSAIGAGYKMRDTTQPRVEPARVYSRHKVWHDSECKRLQQQFRALQGDPEGDAERRAIQQQYKRRVKQLVRRYRVEVARERARQWRKDRNSFWRWYRPNGPHCPFTAKTIAEAFGTKLNSYKGAPTQETQHVAGGTGAQFDISSECPTAPEVAAAIMRMDSKAAGADGIPTALLKPSLPPLLGTEREQGDGSTQSLPSDKDAAIQIADAMHVVFQSISSSAMVPEQWHTALLMPIYKGKGQLADPSNYRPLSIPDVACRVWGSILNQRLLDATKDILPDTMFGFRPGRRTADPLLVLRHMIDMNRAGVGVKFGVAFMDLSAAYDSIDRNLLFTKLKHMGMSDHSINTLKHLYQDTTCIVKCDEGGSAGFTVNIGLRQGCPLSTTLFNLYIWDLHQHLVSDTEGAGVRLQGVADDEHMLVTDMEYADDVALCASTPKQLQDLINSFVAYCDRHGLTVNPKKCEVVVFAKSCRAWSGFGDWKVKGKALPRSRKFKYLGVELHDVIGIKGSAEHRLSCMIAAHSAVSRRLNDMQCPKDPVLMADLFDTITAGAGSYGCEIWSTPFLTGWHLRDCTLQRFQATVYKQALKVPRSTSNLLVFMEMGRYPMQIQWLQRTLRYWNKLVANKANSELLDFVLAAEVHQGLFMDRECWAKELLDGLMFVDPSTDWQTHMMQMKPIENPKGVAGLAKQKFADSYKEFDSDPTDPECPHRQRSTYCHLMHHADDSSLLVTPAYISADMPLASKKAIAAVRLAAAPIQCNTKHGIPYTQRTCQRCGSGVDNEHHMLLECKHTTLAAIRAEHSVLFDEADGVRKLMAAAYKPELATTLGSCIQDMLKCLEAGLEGQPIINTGL